MVILCATPSSGSTLLCSLLADSGVAGRPQSWWRAEGIAPLRLRYADLARDPAGVAAGLIAGLGLPRPAALFHANRRLADAVSAERVARFRAESGRVEREDQPLP